MAIGAGTEKHHGRWRRMATTAVAAAAIAVGDSCVGWKTAEVGNGHQWLEGYVGGRCQFGF